MTTRRLDLRLAARRDDARAPGRDGRPPRLPAGALRRRAASTPAARARRRNCCGRWRSPASPPATSCCCRSRSGPATPRAWGRRRATFLHWVSALIALPAIAYAGRPFFRSALGALRARRTNMDVPISLGVLLASAMSLHETDRRRHARLFRRGDHPAVLPAGRPLSRPARRAAAPARRPSTCWRCRPPRSPCSTPTAAAASCRRRGCGRAMRVLVAAGERIGVDGRVAAGRERHRHQPDRRREHAQAGGARHRRLRRHAQPDRRRWSSR